MTAHFSGGIYLALDRPIDGVEKLVAPATFETALHRGLAQTFTPSPLAPSPPPAHTGTPGPNPSPISLRARPKFSESSKDAPLGVFCVPASDAFNHAPPNAAALGAEVR